MVPDELQQVQVRDQSGIRCFQLRRGRQEDQGVGLPLLDLHQIFHLHLGQQHFLLPAQVEAVQRDRRGARGNQQADGRAQHVSAAAGHGEGHQLQDRGQRGSVHQPARAELLGTSARVEDETGLLRRSDQRQIGSHSRGFAQRA